MNQFALRSVKIWRRLFGAATFAMTTTGVLLGRFLGGRFGRFAEAGGGIVLIIIGATILVEHTLLS